MACTRRHVLVFPGQGSQTVGMGVAVALRNPRAAAVMSAASEMAGFDVLELCEAGPRERLLATEFTQLVVYVTGLASAAELEDHGFRPTAVAGHSVGEITALAFGGAVTREDALRLVLDRGALMASMRHDGAMLAIAGLTVEVVAELCEVLRQPSGILTIAADNAPRHVVVAGYRREIRQLTERLASRRGVRIMPLRTDGAFHSAAYVPVLDRWRELVGQLPVVEPQIPVVSSVTGYIVASPETIRRSLVEQLIRPVRWRQAAQTLGATGGQCIVEAADRPTVARLVQHTLGRSVSMCHPRAVSAERRTA